MLQRAYEPLDRYLKPNRVLVIYGPRRSGKTTLLQSFLQKTNLKARLVSGDDIRIQLVLSSQDFRQIIEFAEGYDLVAIDEAQEIPNVGMGLKILVDQVPGLRVIATGSSSFELSGQVGEPLTGRKRTLVLFPISQSELLVEHNRFELRENLEEYLVYGSYPEVLLAKTRTEKIEIITEIANAYLLKDILALEQIRSSRTLADLLKLLAFQVGNEVSFNELATRLGVDVKTVQRYMDLLEKAFVIFRLGGFSRNLRQEVTRKSKYYFYDNGIRNALIAQFNLLNQRNDIGPLWENFIFMERMKHRTYTEIYANVYFWRTYNQQEIDLVEEREGLLFGYEAKWSVRKSTQSPSLWKDTYPESEYRVVTPENYLDYIV
jgi:uncharacterized protein